jgi:hypothetical protein
MSVNLTISTDHLRIINRALEQTALSIVALTACAHKGKITAEEFADITGPLIPVVKGAVCSMSDVLDQEEAKRI